MAEHVLGIHDVPALNPVKGSAMEEARQLR